jgi:hypothetical protein
VQYKGLLWRYGLLQNLWFVIREGLASRTAAGLQEVEWGCKALGKPARRLTMRKTGRPQAAGAGRSRFCHLPR